MMLMKSLSVVALVLLGGVSNVWGQWVAGNSTITTDVKCFGECGSRLFAGTQRDGLFLSTDNGESWAAFGSGLPGVAIRSMAVLNSGVSAMLFAGTSNGMYASSDTGATWQAVNNGIPVIQYNGISTVAAAGPYVFAGTYGGGVYRSNDGGASWEATNDGLTNGYIYSFTAAGTELFAGTYQNGVFHANINGVNWTPSNNGLKAKEVNVLVADTSGSMPTLIAGNESGGVFLSSDYGSSWSAASALPKANVWSIVLASKNIFAATDSGIFLSTNHGTSWSSVSEGLPGLAVHSLVISGTELVAGTPQNGIWHRPLAEMLPPSKVDGLQTSKLSLYPNPATTLVIIDNSDLPSPIEISITSESGALIRKRFEWSGSPFKVNLSDIPSGVYWLEVKNGNELQKAKLVVNH